MKKIPFTLILILTACLSHAQTLYSTTGAGGDANAGTICKLDLATNTLTAAFSFDGATGANPQASLVQASDGRLYGMTVGGGSSNVGVIFSYDPVTETYTKLLDFDGTNGAYAPGSLVQASDGKLYGTTAGGGSNNKGVIFSYDPATATYAKLYDFDGTNGGQPASGLIQASNGKLYGMTQSGGSSNVGVIFSYDAATVTFAKLLDFDSTNGRYPHGSLVQASDGKLYSMTQQGGINDAGVIFSYDPVTAIYTKLHDFDWTDGAYPDGSLVQASDGKLYGTTSDGAGSSYYGVIFSYDPATATYVNEDFDHSGGYYPGTLMQASNGKLYGMTGEGGGIDSYGASFSFDPVSGTFTKLADFTGSNGSYSYYASFIEVCVPTTWYRDADGDSFGDVNNSITACSSPIPPGYVTNSTDCDDTKLLYADNDGDGFGGSPVACGVANNTDCNDNNAAVHPGAVEICGNGIDDNCDGHVDEGCTSPGTQISISDRAINETNKGGKLMTFMVQLSEPSRIIVRVNYTTQDITAKAGNDYAPRSGTLIFLPGIKKLPLFVLLYGDKKPEADETFRVVLGNPVNAVIADGTGIGTILNDDGMGALQPIAQNQDAGSAVLKDVKLSPNPASGKVNLILTGYSGNLMIELLDINGKMLQEKRIISLSKLSQQPINISGYSNGVYLVTVIDEKGNRKTQKLVISR